MDADGVIDSYVHDVARRLPPRPAQRRRATSCARCWPTTCGRGPRPRGARPTTAMALAMLRGFGRPAETAARYHRPFTIVEPSDTWSFVVAAVIGGGDRLAPVAVAGRGRRRVPRRRPPRPPQRSTLSLRSPGSACSSSLSRQERSCCAGVPDAFAWRPRPVRDRDAVEPPGRATRRSPPSLAAFARAYLAPGPVVEAVTGGRVAASDLAYTDSFAGPLRMLGLVVLLAVPIAL